MGSSGWQEPDVLVHMPSVWEPLGEVDRSYWFGDANSCGELHSDWCNNDADYCRGEFTVSDCVDDVWYECYDECDEDYSGTGLLDVPGPESDHHSGTPADDVDSDYGARHEVRYGVYQGEDADATRCDDYRAPERVGVIVVSDDTCATQSIEHQLYSKTQLPTMWQSLTADFPSYYLCASDHRKAKVPDGVAKKVSRVEAEGFVISTERHRKGRCLAGREFDFEQIRACRAR